MKEEKEKLPENKEQKEHSDITRRDFLVGSGTVVVGGAIGAGLLSGCKGETTTVTQTTTKTVPMTVTTTVGGGGAVTVTQTTTVGAGATATVTATKTVTEGGGIEPWQEVEETFDVISGPSSYENCVIDVKNGKIIRTRPLHYNEKYTDAEIALTDWQYEGRHRVTGETIPLKPLNRSTPTYLSIPFKKRVYSPNRILYPLQRVDWEPGGDPAKINSQKRGISKFKRISWEQAIETVASEVKRIHDKYGIYGILDKADSCHRINKASTFACTRPLFMGCGGYTRSTRNPDSWEGYYYGSSHVSGACLNGFVKPNSLQILENGENAEMIIYQGCDWDTTAQTQGGWPSRIVRWYRHLGIKQIYIAPDMNFQNASNPDKWIPVIPGRDDALQCAIAHVWLTEDTWDKEYVASHAVGMEYIEDYIMGRIDDMVEKTPEWAAPLCGVKPWTIRALARQWAAKKTSTMHHCGGSFIRGPYTHECARWEVVLMGMQGLGAPGRNWTGDYEGAHSPTTGLMVPGIWSMGGGVTGVGPSAAMGGIAMTEFPPRVKQHIPKTRVADAILKGQLDFYGTSGFMMFGMGNPPADQFVKYTYPIPAAEGGTEIHMIVQDHACQTGCWCYSNKYIHALRSPKIECHVIQHIWMEKDCLFADIILPATTNYEESDVISGGAQRHVIGFREEPVPPVGEAKTDVEIGLLVAAKLETYGGIYTGLVNKLTGGKTLKEHCQDSFEICGAMEAGYTWEDLEEKGYIVQPPSEGWDKVPRCLNPFYNDPKKNPLTTPTGKLEFYSQALADGTPDCIERKPYPRFVAGGPASEGWPLDESLLSERAKTYPLVMNAQHPRWREQAQGDDIPWLREIPTCKVKGYDGYMYEPVWINPVDAESRGIKTGDILKVFNDKGVVLGGAWVSERIIPGSVHMDHGTNVDMINVDEADWDDHKNKWIDRSGNVNQILPDMSNGSKYLENFMICSSYLVEVKKVSGDEMLEWRGKYPEAFSRDYDPAYGVLFSNWIEGGTK
ncbi:MAG: molybdopterin-dependent oxidoreductase [Clostridia bacterium]|nr:molybdopterin-dependent oxidoreductase [Clostridia bacterium]